MKKIIQKIVVGSTIINNKNQILVLQRSASEKVMPGLWELPSGKREYLEPALDALKREVFEETGLNIKPVLPISVFDYSVERKEEIRDTTQINFLAVVADNNFTVRISNEHQGYKWISENEIDSVPVSEATRFTIAKAFNIRHISN